MGPEFLSSRGDRRHRQPQDGDSFEDPIESGPSAALAPAAEETDDTLMTYADDEREEGQEDEEDDEDDEDDDEDDTAGVCCGHHNHHHNPHHHLHQQSLCHDFPELYDSDPYPSDDLDMSDDGGAPLVNYLDTASLLTNDINMSASFLGNGYGYDLWSGSNVPGAFPQAGSQDQDAAVQDDGSVSDDSLPAELTSNFTNPAFPLQQAPPDPAPPPPQFEQFLFDSEPDSFIMWFPGGHPVALSNPNPNTLGPGNYGLVDFLKHWAGQSPGLQGLSRERGRFPWMGKINDQNKTHLTHVQYADLEGDQCDFQGMDWEDLGVTRKEARERRLLTYTNYVNKAGSDRWSPHLPDVSLPRTDSFFRFRRMDIRRNVHLSHFQLRNVLASASSTQAFYTGNGVVHKFNPVSGEGKTVMRLGDMPASQISTLAAEHDVLIAGGFTGEYLLRRLDAGDNDDAACHEGTITSHISGITNHVQIHQARQSSSPRAAFASNDMCFRVMDINTETFLSCEAFDYPLNCTALSPDRRLRVMVGDHQNVLITAAESSCGQGRPEIVQELGGHRDYGFACDWADDGWTIATGFQDRSVKIWDARRWTNSSGVATPLCTLRTEMAGVRSLRFSPVGSGKRVLVAAEEADFVSIIDAQTFGSRQTVDIFGEIGGITFSNSGQDLMVLCCDRVRGGLVQLERCGLGAEASWDADEGLLGRREQWWRRGGTYDWPRSEFTEEKRTRESVTRRRRKGAALDAMEPF